MELTVQVDLDDGGRRVRVHIGVAPSAFWHTAILARRPAGAAA
jgi:hypothetical protein